MGSLVATLQPSLTSPTMDVDLPQHPCYRKPDPSSRLKPDTTVRIRYIKMALDTIPDKYPYALPSIEGLYNDKFLPVPFFEFHGAGAPPADIGAPGDVYMDVTRGGQVLYARSEEDWARWTPCAPMEQLLCHPHFVEGGHERYLNFHPDKGTEWVCRRTVMRRQQTLRTANILKNSHFTSAQAGWDLGSTLIRGYLARTPKGSANAETSLSTTSAADPEHAETDLDSSDLFASDSEEISSAEADSDGFYYPSKRARLAASSGSASAPPPSKRKAPPSPLYQHPTPDPETQQLEKELAALQADKDLRKLRRRKRELMASFSTPRGFRVSPELLQTLETDYKKYQGMGSSVTPAEAKHLLPDLRYAVDHAKEKLLGMKANRIETEKQLGERVRLCDAIRQTLQ
ncbi:hypothetical protein C8R45DRAFT_407603 [Mycena sanguinolenta]|nr:hypothetical protein C8R45DRAFT_407603 [Mycena sanguinolenta]